MSPRSKTRDVAARPPSDFAALCELSSELLGSLELSGGVKTLNPAWEAAFGIPAGELRGAPFAELFAQEDREILRAALRRVSLGEPLMPVELRGLRRDGSDVWISWRFTLCPGKRAYLAAGRDVTLSRILQQERRDAQRLSELGLVAAVVAHDFNNILTIMRGSESILRMMPGLTSHHARELDDLNAAIRHAAELVHQVLAYGHRESCPGADVDLNRAIAEMAWMLRRLGSKRIEVSFVLARALAPVRIGEVKLGQILLNLAINARDAMPEGGNLLIETANVRLDPARTPLLPAAPPGEYVRLRVCDSGIGMTPEIREHLFKPFFTTKKNGTGLGLFSVRRAVEECGGRIRVESIPGRGTTFEIYFPRR